MGTRPPALLVAGAVVLLANSVYLAAVASPTLFFYGNVALHVSLGVVVAAAREAGEAEGGQRGEEQPAESSHRAAGTRLESR